MKYLKRSVLLDPRFQKIGLSLLIVGTGTLLSQMGYCSVESSLTQIEAKLTTVILPAAAILGLIVAGLSFVAGSPNARSHLILAITGALIGFGAPQIMTFIRGMVN